MIRLNFTKEEIQEAVQFVLNNLTKITPPPQDAGVPTLTKWAKRLPRKTKLGLLAIYHEIWGHGGRHSYWSNWLGDLKYSIRFEITPLILYYIYHALVYINSSNPQRWQKIAEKLHFRLLTQQHCPPLQTGENVL